MLFLRTAILEKTAKFSVYVEPGNTKWEFTIGSTASREQTKAVVFLLVALFYCL